MKICLICHKEHKAKTECCTKCNRKIVEITKRYCKEYWNKDYRPKIHEHKFKISIARILKIKDLYNQNDVLNFIENNLDVLRKTKFNHGEILINKRQLKNKLYNKEY
jgi:hypothetical protein